MHQVANDPDENNRNRMFSIYLHIDTQAHRHTHTHQAIIVVAHISPNAQRRTSKEFITSIDKL